MVVVAPARTGAGDRCLTLEQGPQTAAAAREPLHRRGQPLNGQLTTLGARFAGVVQTAPTYRLFALDTIPAKPGLVRVGDDGASLEGELWSLPVAGLGAFLAALPAPMTLGPVTLEDGRVVVGFGCEAAAVADAPDITEFGSWVAYLAGAPA